MLTILLKYLLIFFLGAISGYIIEVFFRRFISQKRWVNPGFLTGPYLPLYGFGLVCLYLICEIDFSSFNLSVNIEILIKTLIILISMTLIEYIAGLIFIKGMKIKLWDYSNQWLNIQDIICPLFSFFWGVIGFAYYILLHNLIVSFVSFFLEHIILSFFIGIILGIFIVDLCTSLHLATKISKFAREKNIIVSYETFKDEVKKIPTKIKFAFKEASEKYENRIAEFKNTSISFSQARYDFFALFGFATSFIGFSIIALAISKIGLKSKKYKNFAIAGIVISIVETIAIITLVIVFGFNK